ncbi:MULTISPECIES: NB-ARC domain-containing protein [unclassified Microcoleus]|uniref:NB-ARC domain-containing protein n=1 Tax=unclassified Microcoleus TaxID=2642155 RepID=UPI0025F0115D|nr:MULTISPECIES: NB-ARC domain-containing protein [unclassified Microcoleus]
MDAEEILRFADNLVFAKTGKRLDDLQRAVVRGASQRKTYPKIAKESYSTPRHIRNVASKLWQLFSQALEENITKSNFCSAMERYQISKVSNSGHFNLVQKGNINVCTETSHHPKTSQNSPPTQTSNEDDTQQKPRLDLRDAPDITSFYDRTSELATLQQWILQDRTRLVAILGLSGIGKTNLALHLLPQIQHQFEYIIWRSLGTSPTLNHTLKSLIKFLSNLPEIELPASTDELLSLLIDKLRSHRCLIILDDVQTILSSGQIAGNYRPEYENYSTLFKRIGETCHNSCLIVNSWEPPREIVALNRENPRIRTLPLNGLGAAAGEILREKGLLEPEKWETLIDIYRGNPLWLKIVAAMIKELFSGRGAEFLKYDTLFLGEELKARLQQQCDRLSELEKQVMCCIANQIESVSISQLLENLQLSPDDLCKALLSLGNRAFIEKQEPDNKALFSLSPVIRQYVKTEYCREGIAT